MMMRRLLSLLMMVTIAMASGASASVALCHHASEHEHAAALESHIESVSGDAHAEEAAAAAIKAFAKAHAGSMSLAHYVAPDSIDAPIPFVIRSVPIRPVNVVMPGGRAPPPLLQPPSA